MVKNPSANAGDTAEEGLIPGLGRFPWRREWQPAAVFLLGESHGQRSLEGYRVAKSWTQLKQHSTAHKPQYFGHPMQSQLTGKDPDARND